MAIWQVYSFSMPEASEMTLLIGHNELSTWVHTQLAGISRAGISFEPTSDSRHSAHRQPQA